MHEPTLTFSELPILSLIRQLVKADSLIITDSYNYSILKDIGTTVVLVKDQEIGHIEQIRQQTAYTHIIAVGGCTALDFGRACAIGKMLIVVPTILSNACFSTDRSVINRDGVYKSEKTIAPKETIICMPTILQNHADHIKHWTSSGIGDLLTAIGASIEFEFNKNESFEEVTTDQIAGNIPVCMEALEWLRVSFKDYDAATLKRLAYYLHESSVDVIRNGSTRFNAATEHLLYYKMQERQQYPPMLTTHGRIVSIGNLLTARMLAEETGQSLIYNALRSAYRKIGLPLTYSELASIKVMRKHIIEGIAELMKGDNNLYVHYFSTRDYSIFNRIFNQ